MSLRDYCGTRYRRYELSPWTSNIVPVTVLPSSTLTRWSDSENLPLQVPGRPSKMSALSFATERVSPETRGRILMSLCHVGQYLSWSFAAPFS